jgi:magnesium-transporting ATPase (P-type)
MITGDAIWLGILVFVAMGLTIMIFTFKNQIFSILSAGLWALLAINRFSHATVANYSDFDYTIGYFLFAVSLFCLTTMFWYFKKPKAEKAIVEEEDYGERKEKRVAQLRKRRPIVRKRRKDIDDWAKDI